MILNFNSSMIFHLYNTKKEPSLITNTRSSSLIFCFVKTYSPYKSTMISIFYLFSVHSPSHLPAELTKTCVYIPLTFPDACVTLTKENLHNG